MNIALLGSTGSIGMQCLDIVNAFPKRFRIKALACGSNAALFNKQLQRFKPAYAAIADENAAKDVVVPDGTRLLTGKNAAAELAKLDCVDTVLVAIVGIAGLDAAYNAAKYNKRLALATKEALVTGGALVNAELNVNNGIIYPVDSEHSAIFQCLNGENKSSIRRLLLTASGGAFRDYSYEMLKTATATQALKHPNWSMGKKITVDCATMMNKGLEVIEARWLFDIPQERIDVLIHRQSIIHSMVEFTDGAVKAQLGMPDMRLPIMYALSYPERMDADLPRLDFTSLAGGLTFEQPDNNRFPCLNLARKALIKGGNMPTILNAANEVAVDAYLRDKLDFYGIARTVSNAMDKCTYIANPTLDEIHDTDYEVRRRCIDDNLMK